MLKQSSLELLTVTKSFLSLFSISQAKWISGDWREDFFVDILAKHKSE